MIFVWACVREREKENKTIYIKETCYDKKKKLFETLTFTRVLTLITDARNNSVKN